MFSQDGVTPLFIAAQKKLDEVVKLLLRAGANPDLARHEVRKWCSSWLIVQSGDIV